LGDLMSIQLKGNDNSSFSDTATFVGQIMPQRIEFAGAGLAGKYITSDGFQVLTSGTTYIGDLAGAGPNITLNGNGTQRWADFSTGNGVYATGPDGSVAIRNDDPFAEALTVYSGGTSSSPAPGNKVLSIGGNGAIANLSGTITTIASERRLKENIVSIDAAVSWETVKNTPYYSYNFKSVTDVACYGPIVDEVPPEMVVQPMEKNEEGEIVPRSDEEGPVRTYDNAMLQARLYTALQTALTRIESLEAKVTALEGGQS
jgi:hypothetical protein